MKSTLFATAFSLLLAACTASAPPTAPVVDVRTVTASIDVPVPCVDKAPAAPQFLSDKDLLTGSGAQVVDQLWRDHLLSRDYIAQLAPLVKGCSIVSSVKSATSEAEVTRATH